MGQCFWKKTKVNDQRQKASETRHQKEGDKAQEEKLGLTPSARRQPVQRTPQHAGKSSLLLDVKLRAAGRQFGGKNPQHLQTESLIDGTRAVRRRVL